MTDSRKAFLNSVREFLPWSQTHTGDMQAHVRAVDASPYEPMGFAVVECTSPDDLARLFSIASRFHVSLTLRGAGTALSGQSTPSGVAVLLKGGSWRFLDVLENGRLVRAGCGMKGADINGALAPFGRFINSDPSSIASATIGGMAANNAAGLSCTVENNIYHRLRAMQFMLADGTCVDTSNTDSVAQFRKTHASLLGALAGLRKKLLDDGDAAEKVRRKHRIRNTCGYGLNALVDFEDPLDILVHLLVGSEGTLGFIFSVTLETSPVLPLRGTAMAGFASLDEAMKAVVAMRSACELHACEFLDAISLRSLAMLPGFPEELKPGSGDSDDCALLLEVRAATEDVLESKIRTVRSVLDGFNPRMPADFVTDVSECEKLWDIRRALFPALAGTRLPTEYAYVEDYCVPVEQLPEACHQFVDVLRAEGFTRSGVNGHALHGNIHCTIPIEISRPGEVDKLKRVLDGAAEIILSHDGSLKAEHGTGRAVAPFVRREWGDFLYGVMQDVKKLLDPDRILNIGVLLNEDPMGHLSNIKYIAEVGGGLDLCVDCGFCESVCPSAKTGFSPRQRIYAMRAVKGLRAAGEEARAEEWEKGFLRDGVDMCATDGLCSTRCPLGINVADAMKVCRHELLSGFARWAASFARRHVSLVSGTVSAALDVCSALDGVMGHDLSVRAGKMAGRVSGMTLPDFREVGLRGSSAVPATVKRGGGKIVYFPSCAVRTMGYSGTSGRAVEPLMDVALRLIEKAGFEVVIPGNVTSLCCGKAFETKGMKEEADKCALSLGQALLEASEGGRHPVMCDTSPCLARMRKTLDSNLHMFEPVEFTLRFLADRLRFVKRHHCVAIHPTCSTRSMGLAEKMREVALLCSDEVVLPDGIFCCGFSGDKGFSRPELNAGALSGLAEKISSCEAGYSTSRTCEIGLTLHGGRFYSNLLYLIDECTEPAS